MMGDAYAPPERRLRTVQVFAPSADVRRIAGIIAERAWVGRGVRIYAWLDGTFVATVIGSHADAVMLTMYADHLVATYARHANGRGPLFVDVLDQLRTTRAGVA